MITQQSLSSLSSLSKRVEDFFILLTVSSRLATHCMVMGSRETTRSSPSSSVKISSWTSCTLQGKEDKPLIMPVSQAPPLELVILVFMWMSTDTNHLLTHTLAHKAQPLMVPPPPVDIGPPAGSAWSQQMRNDLRVVCYSFAIPRDHVGRIVRAETQKLLRNCPRNVPKSLKCQPIHRGPHRGSDWALTCWNTGPLAGVPVVPSVSLEIHEWASMAWSFSSMSDQIKIWGI